MALTQRSIGKSRHRIILLVLTAITLLSLDLSSRSLGAVPAGEDVEVGGGCALEDDDLPALHLPHSSSSSSTTQSRIRLSGSARSPRHARREATRRGGVST